ncbi:MAG TPA: pyridoxal 5'-phosphate synthase glutaminase subunit PdxT [Acidimicrobiia bacterium]|nr:pyridoxal 5'-phosphate synthase glutaminase subunit PdxT [Acidimicrobiia bacterium]
MRAGVLALQGDVREHATILEELGAEVVRVRSAPDLEEIDALVIPGGESTTIGKLADRYGLVEPLRKAISDGMPTLGTCAGMIFLAGATTESRSQVQLGVLDVVVRRNAFGRQADSGEREVDVAGLDAPVNGVFIRAPWIEKVGEGVEILAELDGHPVMVREGNVIAASFHPELAGDTRLHRMLLEMVEES